MKQITITDVRQALYDMLLRTAENRTDEELLASDFQDDLEMYENRMYDLVTNLEIRCHVAIPPTVLTALESNNTVQNFLLEANKQLRDLDEE